MNMFTVKTRHLGEHRESTIGTFESIGEAETTASAVNNKPFSFYYAWVEQDTPRSGGQHRYNGFH